MEKIDKIYYIIILHNFPVNAKDQQEMIIRRQHTLYEFRNASEALDVRHVERRSVW